MLSDKELRAIVAEYILENAESDNADCLHETDELEDEKDYRRALKWYGVAKVHVEFEDEKEWYSNESS